MHLFNPSFSYKIRILNFSQGLGNYTVVLAFANYIYFGRMNARL